MVNKRLIPPVYGNLYYSLRELSLKLDDLLKNCTKKSNQTLLDFGCGSKPYKSLVEKYGVKYLGADLSIVSDIDIEIDIEGTLQLKDESVDILLSSQVLEHVYNTDKYLKECYRVLKPDGNLIITTHGHWVFHPDPNDYWRWTSQGLKEIIKKHSFEIEHFSGIMNIKSVALQYLQDTIRTKLKFKIVITLFTYFMQVLIRINEKFSEKSDHDSGIYVVKATKKS
jgi:SAM-dependent methyltransferase